MKIVIGILCYILGCLSGVCFLSLFIVGKRADEEMNIDCRNEAEKN